MKKLIILSIIMFCAVVLVGCGKSSPADDLSYLQPSIEQGDGSVLDQGTENAGGSEQNPNDGSEDDARVSESESFDPDEYYDEEIDELLYYFESLVRG